MFDDLNCLYLLLLRVFCGCCALLTWFVWGVWVFDCLWLLLLLVDLVAYLIFCCFACLLFYGSAPLLLVLGWFVCVCCVRELFGLLFD